MSQTAPKTPLATQGFPSLPQTTPRSTRQQQQAVELVKAQAEQRVRLGVKLLKAAENQTTHQQRQFEAFKDQEQQAREQLQNDIASTLQTYDQWMARFDERFSAKLRTIEKKVESIESKWTQTEHRIMSLLGRLEALLDHRRATPAAKPTPQDPPVKSDQAHHTPQSEPDGTVRPPPAGQHRDPHLDTIYRDALKQLQRDITPPSA